MKNPNISASYGSGISKAQIESALVDGEPQTELLTLLEISGSQQTASKWSTRITGANPWDHEFTETELNELRAELSTVLFDRFSGKNASSTDHSGLDIDAIIDLAVGSPLSETYHRLVKKEMGLEPDTVNWTAGRPDNADHLKVIIIGAGPSGITAAIRLQKLGISFSIYDAGNDFGGTWLHNTYPGCGVDIASHYFSFSYAPNSEWSRYYAKQPEILAYLQKTATDAGLTDHAFFNTEVLAARYDETNQKWQLTTNSSDGCVSNVSADILVTATGLLSAPKIPDFPGLDKFQGKYFHAATWDHSVDYAGKKVALIGTGASANQIGPTIAPEVQELIVFQRSAQWNIGVQNYMDSVSQGEKWLLAHVPEYSRWFRARTMLSQNDSLRPAAEVDPHWDGLDGSISEENFQIRRTLEQYIKDELGDRQDLLPLALPDYPPFTKRMLRDNGWYTMMRRKNVEVVPAKNLHFTECGIVDAQGVSHEIDVAVFATGFDASRALGTLEISGRNGTTIRDVWGDDNPRAHYGITIPGFPNLFVLYGPNTNIGTGGSIILQAETWTRYVAEAIVQKVEHGAAEIECRPQAMQKYNEDMDKRLAKMIWSVSDGTTWYRNSAGRVVANMPWSTPEYWAMTQNVQIGDFELLNRDGKPITPMEIARSNAS